MDDVEKWSWEDGLAHDAVSGGMLSSGVHGRRGYCGCCSFLQTGWQVIRYVFSLRVSCSFAFSYSVFLSSFSLSVLLSTG